MGRRAPWRRLAADRGGGPAIEFAILAPLLIMLLMGGYDASAALICYWRVTAAAQEIVKIATELSVQPDQSTSLTPYQVFQAQTAVYAVDPSLRSGAIPFAVVVTGIVFTASPANCTPGVNCTYAASTAWSVPGGNLSVTRPCGQLAQVSPSATPSLSNIPTAGMTALTSLVAVDVREVFTPMFARFIAAPIAISSSALLVPRVGAASQYVEYDIAGGQARSDPYVCQGYL